MRRLRAFTWFLLSLCPVQLAAQAVVTSLEPDEVAVTVYRAPGRSPDASFDLQWLEGYALISETRSVSIPAGESEVRFEGVAGGIQPRSAIVSGFPDGIVERNRDAYLLSAGSLLDRSLGRRVHLRRISRESGKIVEQDAVIRSGAEGAVVLQTSKGFEALRCTGQPETLVYGQVPAGLSARPTLSVRTRSDRPVTAKITLSYLAHGFDWQANYIANLSADGRRLDLFAWLTLASMDETSFARAHAQAVAGRLNREDQDIDAPEAPVLVLRCWPQGRTSDIAFDRIPGVSITKFSDGVGDSISAEDLGSLPEQNIVVTGSRVRREELGDLKLYRIPEPVTVAANSQKQVAFLEQNRVEVSQVYRQRVDADELFDAQPATRYLLSRNRIEEGLGLPLPAGRLQLFAEAGGRPILLGEGSLGDKAVGENVEIALGESPAILATLEETESSGDRNEYRLTVANSQPAPIRYEAEFQLDDDEKMRPAARLSRRDGRPLWAVTVPANGRATLQYRIDRKDG